MSAPREISPEMLPLYDELNEVAAYLESLITRTCGSRRGFLVIIAPPDNSSAALTVHNLIDHDCAKQVMLDFIENGAEAFGE